MPIWDSMCKHFTRGNAREGNWGGRQRWRRELSDCSVSQSGLSEGEREGMREGVFLDCHAAEESFGKAVGESSSPLFIRGIPPPRNGPLLASQPLSVPGQGQPLGGVALAPTLLSEQHLGPLINYPQRSWQSRGRAFSWLP